MTISGYINYLSRKLEAIYNENEALSIANYFVEELLSLDRIYILTNSGNELSTEQVEKLKSVESRLINGEPVQYVTNVSWFYGLKFYVNKNVLIPRQETEILVDFLIKNHKNPKNNLKILDIGTGSGCIPVSLKKFIPSSEVYAIDISEEALEVCKKNAMLHNVEIFMSKYDVLSKRDFPYDEKFDIIVSNPPYVLNSEKTEMHINVTGYEPDLALYVDDSDPLIFYRNILQITKKNTCSGTEFIFEINERYANEMIKLASEYGLESCEIIKDLQEKDRFIFAIVS